MFLRILLDHKVPCKDLQESYKNTEEILKDLLRCVYNHQKILQVKQHAIGPCESILAQCLTLKGPCVLKHFITKNQHTFC